jgi:anaerobic selenocysteine-containing dehydrogenase
MLLMHPVDAEARGLKDGQRVCLESKTGTIAVPLGVTDRIMQGIVSLPHGWGHHRPGTKLNVASEYSGASINDVTDDTLVDLLSGVAGFSGIPVRVRAASTPA